MHFLLSIVSIVAFGGLSGVVLYRLLWHPLNKFPGPKLAAASSLYKKFYDGIRGGDLVSHLQELHDRYGPVVRLSPNELHFSDPSSYSRIYYIGSPYPKYQPFYDSFAARDTSFGLINPGHAKIRRDMISPLFSRRAILKLESTIQRKVDRFVDLLARYRPNKPVNMFYALRSLTLDIITEYCFAQCPDTIEANNFAHPLVVSFQRRLSFRPLSVCVPFILPLLFYLPNWILGTIFPSTQEVWTYREQITKRVNIVLENPELLEHSEHETIYHHLIVPSFSKRLPGNTPSRDALIEEAEVLLGAGSDTVANTCTTGLFHALYNPNVYKNIQVELKVAWPDADSPMPYEKLEKLPYLTAFIKESLRVSYGVVSPLPRVVTTPGAVIGGCNIPVGTVVSMSIVFLHKSPEIYDAPDTFDPERWLGQDAPKLESYLMPFSRGPRMCLGLNLAWCELYLIFGTILRKIDMELYQTGPEDFTKFKDTFVPAYQGRQMQVLVKEGS